MTREIKFRAWDKWNNSFEENTHRVMIELRGVVYNSEYGDEQPERYELMQYTGLKDKNGVEIYEGDIVKVTNTALTGKYRCNVFTIKFEEIRVLAGHKYMGFNFQFNVDQVEVIGNIYETPELLQGEE